MLCSACRLPRAAHTPSVLTPPAPATPPSPPTGPSPPQPLSNGVGAKHKSQPRTLERNLTGDRVCAGVIRLSELIREDPHPTALVSSKRGRCGGEKMAGVTGCGGAGSPRAPSLDQYLDCGLWSRPRDGECPLEPPSLRRCVAAPRSLVGTWTPCASCALGCPAGPASLSALLPTLCYGAPWPLQVGPHLLLTSRALSRLLPQA